jgi:hypothetical protein
MTWQRLSTACAAMMIAALIAAGAAAENHSLGLDQYLGHYPDHRFMALPAVHNPLARLLGERLERFLKRFQVLSPIDKVSNDVMAEGCVRHNCANEQAAFAIDLDTGEATAASLTQGKYMDIYSKSTTRYNDLPPGIRRWISSRTSQSTAFKKIKFRFFK